MKKFYCSLFTLLALVSMSIGFVACGSDDDDDNSVGDQALVGKWYSQQGTVYVIGWMFNSNGSCYYGEWGTHQSEKWGDDATGKWTTDGKKLTVTWTDEEGSDIEIYSYQIENAGKTLLLTNKRDKTYEFKKQ